MTVKEYHIRTTLPKSSAKLITIVPATSLAHPQPHGRNELFPRILTADTNNSDYCNMSTETRGTGARGLQVQLRSAGTMKRKVHGCTGETACPKAVSEFVVVERGTREKWRIDLQTVKATSVLGRPVKLEAWLLTRQDLLERDNRRR